MRVHRFGVFVLVAISVVARSAGAQQAPAAEVTPFVALGTPGASPVGVWVTVPITAALSVESEVAYRRGEGEIHALSSSVSLLYWLPRLGPATPYVAAGVGLAQYGAPVFGTTGGPIGTQSRLAMQVNAGGGVKTRVSDTLDLRTDARWSQSFGRDGSEQFRIAQGISFDIARKGGDAQVSAPGTQRVRRK